MIWQLLLVLALAGFGFCVLWAHVLMTLARPFQSVWKRLLDADLRRSPPLLGEPPLLIHGGEHLSIHGLLAYERELEKEASCPPQSVSGIIPVIDSLPLEDAVQYDTVCLHTGYDVSDVRGSQKVLLR